MLTIQEVIEIHATHDVDINETEAEESLKWAMQGNPDYATLVQRVHNAAIQEGQDQRASAAESAEFESHYE